MLLPLLVLGLEVSGVVASASAAASQTRRLLSRSVRRVRLGGVDCTMPDDDPPACSESSSVGEVCTSLAKDLKPTQSSLGFVLKQCKTAKYNGKKASKMAKYLAEDSHLVPAVLGPNGGIYITDHHHLSRGLYESDYADVPENICITRDLSNLNSTLAFWNAMNATHSVWTFDHKGVAYATMEEVVKAIPATIAGSFDDDPFRSLSEYIRDKDGYIKCKPDTPTADFPQVRGRGGGEDGEREGGARRGGEARRGESGLRTEAASPPIAAGQR